MGNYNLLEKIEFIRKLSQNYKKKRIILDENKLNFGFDTFSSLKNVDNSDGDIKGYPFMIYNKNDPIKYGLKVIPIDTSFSRDQHPCQLEIIFLKHLSKYITTLTPHVVPYIHSQKVSNKCTALKKLNLKNLETKSFIKSNSLLLVSQYIEGGSLEKWVFKRYENDNNLSDYEWKYMIFGLIYTLHVWQLNFRMNHNDCHFGNILVDESLKGNGYYVYTINNKVYYLKNQGFLCMFWDFEVSASYNNSIPQNYPNQLILTNTFYDKKKGINIEKLSKTTFTTPINFNEVYDVHYLLGSILDLAQSETICNWIKDLYPEELIDEIDMSSTMSSESFINSSNTSSLYRTSEESSEIYSSETDNSESESDSESETDSIKNLYIEKGRLINGVEKLYDLPNPLHVLESGFFDEFLIKPKDFDEKTAIFFKERI
jgi:hypothetical protein